MRRNNKQFGKDTHRPGTVSLGRRSSLAATVLGLCELGSTEIRLSPQMHDADLQWLYTLSHEGSHREQLLSTTFGYTQFLLARIEIAGRRHTLPSLLSGAQEALYDTIVSSFDAHEGYATINEYVMRDSLVSLGISAPNVPLPTPRYQRAMKPYRAVVEALPPILRPFTHFLLRAFSEIVFDTGILQIARTTNLNVGDIHASLAEQQAQPNYRLNLLSELLIKQVEREPLGEEWDFFIKLSEHTPGLDLSLISELRFKMSGIKGIIYRKKILNNARRVLRAIVGANIKGHHVDSGPQTVHAFHNWCFEKFSQFCLLNGPMLNFDDEPEEAAKVTLNDIYLSGLPADILPVVSVTGDPSTFIDQTLAEPRARLAIALRLQGDGTEQEFTACQVRLVRFAPRTEAWNGPGTKPHQRIFVDCPCFDTLMPVHEALNLLARLYEVTDIIYFNTMLMNKAQAALSDRVVGMTKATMIHLVDDYFGITTDKERLDALRKLHSRGHRGFCPFYREDWIAIFFELTLHTFLGAVVLRTTAEHMFEGKLDEWIERCTKQQADLLRDEDYRIALGSLCTFVKIFINGGFRDPEGG